MNYSTYILSILFYIFIGTTNAQTTFSEITSGSGIQHTHDAFAQMGGGIVIFDYNNDSLSDIFLTGGNNISALYKNTGQDSFVNVSLQAGFQVTDTFPVSGAVSGDIDNDGFRDIFLYTHPGHRNILMYNNGDGTFSDITFSAGVQGDSMWTHSASFGDINRDGFIDLYVGEFIELPNVITDSLGNFIAFSHICIPNTLYLNNGDNTFSDVSNLLNASDTGCALSTLMTDYDLDGDADLLVINDFGAWVSPNTIYQNEYPNPFVNVGSSSSIQTGIYGMGVAVGDYDQDMDLDYYATNIGRNVLKRNLGNGTFVDTTDAAGVANHWVMMDTLQSTGWGCGFIDIDNDSRLDLYVANGVIDAIPELMTSVHDPDKLYHNNGDGTFTDISHLLPQDSFTCSRGFAYADFDNDGDIDLFPVHIRANFLNPINSRHIFKNNLNNGLNWLNLKLIGTVSNRDAYGAKIYMHCGNTSWLHEVSGQGSHCSQHSSVAHFGLDTNTVADSILIEWPSGHIDRIYQLPSNQYLEYTEGQSSSIAVEILTLIDNQVCANYTTQLYTNGQFNSYQWSTGDTSSSIVVNSDGWYYLTVTDPNLNVSIDSVNVSLNFADSLVINSQNITCHGQSNGQASVAYLGNTGILSYQWSNGSTAASINGLDKGPYTVTITNIFGCADSVQFYIYSPIAFDLQAAVTEVSCYGDSSGIIDLSLSGGTAPYSFNWSNNSSTEDQTNLTFGNYSVFISDSNGCSTTASYFINAPLSPILPNFVSDTICEGENNGQIDLNVSGGTGPYQFIWSNGATTEDIDQLNSGNYQLTIVDANACMSIFEDSIVVYPDIVYTATIQLDSSSSNGSIYISSQQTLSYLWDNGAVDSFLMNVPPGNYLLTIVDSNNCSTDSLFSIPLIQNTVISNALSASIKIFPNPSYGYLTIQFKHPYVLVVELEILDASGKKIESLSIHSNQIYQWEHHQLPAGNYFIRCTDVEMDALQFIKTNL